MADSPSDEHRSDEEIIRAVTAGDRNSYQILVERYQQRMFALIFRQVGDRTVAAELTQECLVKGYLALKDFRFESKFSSWLTRIAINCTNTYFKSKSYRQRMRSEKFEIEKHDMSNAGQIEAQIAEAKLDCFRRSLAALKPELREIISLVALEGKSYEDAAELLDIPLGTVRSRLNTARLRLRDALALEMKRSSDDES